MKKFTLLTSVIIILSLSATLVADYLWPLPYGNELTSIFGSSRIRRYHAGIDVRTGGVIGKEVLAPENGFIMRVRASYFGYGKAIYLRFDDGYIAVFGHLSRFTTEIERYVQDQQLATESYRQDLYPSEGRFRVRRGEVIGYSGSTGVGAPHLHFEIRSPDNIPLNPLSFSGLEVEDNSHPRIERLRLFGFGNDELAAALGWEITQHFKRSSDGVYRLNRPLPCSEYAYWVSAEVVDFVSRNRWDKPTYGVRMNQNGKRIYELTYDVLPFEEGYRLEIDRNFQAAGVGDEYFYNFPPRGMEGDPLADGICGAITDFDHPIEIEARDVAGNLSRAEILFYPDSTLTGNFPVRKAEYAKLQRLLTNAGYMDTSLVASVIPAGRELFMLLKSPDERPKFINVSAGEFSSVGPPNVQSLGLGYYLVRITELVRTAATEAPPLLTVEQQDAVGGVRYSEVPCDYHFPWGANPLGMGRLISADGRFEVLFPPLAEAFYSFDAHHFFRIDTVQTSMGITYVLYPNDMPLSSQITYRYTDDLPLPDGAQFYADAGTALFYLGADRSVDGRRLDLKSYSPGRVTVRNDDVAPSIRNIVPRRDAMLANRRLKVSCTIRDEMSGIGEDIEIRVDGRWIVPVYDFETDRVTAESHFDLTPGGHTLVIKATDKAGNTRTYDGRFSISDN